MRRSAGDGQRGRRRHLRVSLAVLVAACVGVSAGLAVGLGGGVSSATVCRFGASGSSSTDPPPTVPTLPKPPVTIPTAGPIDQNCFGGPDTDYDGILDVEDNCQGYYNPDQVDTDNDSGPPPYPPRAAQQAGAVQRDPMTGGDICDLDDDGDGIKDFDDNCPKKANKDQADSDHDGIGDACDPQKNVPNPALAAAVRQAPHLTVLKMARRLRVAEIRSGVTVPVKCSAQCIIAGQLLVTARTARRLRLAKASGMSVLAAGSGGVESAGTTYVFVRLTKARLRRVAGARTVHAVLRLVAKDDVGNQDVVQRPLVLRR